jgi:hypothetical protein
MVLDCWCRTTSLKNLSKSSLSITSSSSRRSPSSIFRRRSLSFFTPRYAALPRRTSGPAFQLGRTPLALCPSTDHRTSVGRSSLRDLKEMNHAPRETTSRARPQSVPDSQQRGPNQRASRSSSADVPDPVLEPETCLFVTFMVTYRHEREQPSNDCHSRPGVDGWP